MLTNYRFRILYMKRLVPQQHLGTRQASLFSFLELDPRSSPKVKFQEENKVMPGEAPQAKGPQRRWTGVSLKNSLSTVVSKTREF